MLQILLCITTGVLGDVPIFNQKATDLQKRLATPIFQVKAIDVRGHFWWPHIHDFKKSNNHMTFWIFTIIPYFSKYFQMILGMQLNADDYIDIFVIDSHCSP